MDEIEVYILKFLFEQELKRGDSDWQEWSVKEIKKLIQRNGQNNG